MTDTTVVPDATPTSEERSLALIVDGSRMLAEAVGVFQIRQVRALAIAATGYAKARDLGADAIRQAATVVILATERLGEEIAAGQEAGTIATAGGSPILRAAEDGPATLAELGISANLAADGQRLAADPAAVAAYLDQPGIPSLRGALRAASGVNRAAVRAAVEDAADQRFALVREALGHLDSACTLVDRTAPFEPEEIDALGFRARHLIASLKPARHRPRDLDAEPARPDPNAITCADFAAHRSAHRWSDERGWRCWTCEPAGAPS